MGVYKGLPHGTGLSRPRLSRLQSLLVVVLCCVLVAGCSGISSSDDASEEDQGAGDSILPMTITEWMFPPGVPHTTGKPSGVAHLSVSPMEPGENSLTVTLTDLQGRPLPSVTARSIVDLSMKAITPGSESVVTELAPVQGDGASWQVESLDFPAQNWYELVVTLRDADEAIAASTMYILLPDPSVHGRDALDYPESNTDAEALFRKSIERQASWQAGKWRESLGSGTDVLVVSQFTLTNRPTAPPAFSVDSLYAGSFRAKPDGSTPEPPQQRFANRITIGDEGWSRRESDFWGTVPTRGIATFEERTEIYRGATNFQAGGTDTIRGTDVEIITFYLPPDGGQSEAWFVWWIDPDTGDLLRLAMIARMHFMIWDFYGINGSYTVAPPAADDLASPAAGN